MGHQPTSHEMKSAVLLDGEKTLASHRRTVAATFQIHHSKGTRSVARSARQNLRAPGSSPAWSRPAPARSTTRGTGGGRWQLQLRRKPRRPREAKLSLGERLLLSQGSTK